MLVVTLEAQGATDALGDRLILEINHYNYSQRQMEVYYLAKRHLEPEPKDQKAPPFALPSADNWANLLAEFKLDMVIEQETLRVSGFNPTSRMLDKANEVYLERISRHPEAQSYAERLGLDDRSRRRVFSSVLRVESFRNSKQRQANVVSESEKDEASDRKSRFLNKSSDPNHWQDELSSRAIVRFFDGAYVYQPIFPNAKKKN